MLVDYVEMSAHLALQLGMQDLGRRQVKIFRGKSRDEGVHLRRFDGHDKIRVEGKPRPAVGDGGQPADDAVGDARLLQAVGDLLRPRHIR